jgi:hypothetical protein
MGKAKRTRRQRLGFLSTRRTPARSCPVCHRVLDAATCVSIDPADPSPTMQPGDITVCAYCGVGLVLTVDGFQPASAEDLDRLPPELRVVHDAWEARNPPPTTKH